MPHLIRFAAYAALGPITGPLAAGVVRNLRKREWLLAALYLIALPLTWLDLGAVGAILARYDLSHLH